MFDVRGRPGRTTLLSLLLVLVAGCIQQLDTGASKGSVSSSEKDLTAAAAPSDQCHPACPSGQFCLAGSCLPVDTTTPPIELDDGTTTTDSCVKTTRRAMAIRQQYCAGCHAPPAKLGGLDCVLDDAKLVKAGSSSVMDSAGKPQRLIIPGDPQNSRFYQRLLRGEMPPNQAPPLPELPRPTVADVSVLEAWITNCLGASPHESSEDAGAD